MDKYLQKAAEKTNEGIHCYYVYTLVDDEGNVRYVGRTKNITARLAAHQKPGNKNSSLNKGEIISNLTYAQSRALEQTLMVYYHTRNFVDDEFGNSSINGVGKYGNNRKDYHHALSAIFDYADNVLDNEWRNMKEDIGAWW